MWMGYASIASAAPLAHNPLGLGLGSQPHLQLEDGSVYSQPSPTTHTNSLPFLLCLLSSCSLTCAVIGDTAADGGPFWPPCLAAEPSAWGVQGKATWGQKGLSGPTQLGKHADFGGYGTLPVNILLKGRIPVKERLLTQEGATPLQQLCLKSSGQPSYRPL